MPIGNAINSLPVAYTPLNGSGRKIAYALSFQTVEGGLVAVPSVISHAIVPLEASVDIVSTSMLIYSPMIDETAQSSVNPEFFALLAGFMGLEGEAVLADAYGVLTAAGLAAFDIDGNLSPVPSQIHSPHCDFRSLYLVPGESIYGNVVNSNALGMSALNSRVGGVLRTFISICNPTANARFVGGVTAGAESEAEAQGNALFDPIAPVSADAVLSDLGNAIFSPCTVIEVAQDAAPFGSAVLAAGSEMGQDIAQATGYGVLVLGGQASPEMTAEMIARCSILVELGSNANAEGVIFPLCLHIASGFTASEAAAYASGQSQRICHGMTDLEAVAYMTGLPRDPIAVAVSIVYAIGWDELRTVDVIESIVNRVSPESIVYRVAPESIVYGEVS